MPGATRSCTKKVPPSPPHRLPRPRETELHNSKFNKKPMICEGIPLHTFGIKFSGVYRNVQELVQSKERIRDIRVELIICENSLKLVKGSLKLGSAQTKPLNLSKKCHNVDFEIDVLRFVEKQKSIRRDEIQKDELYSNMPEMQLILREIQKRGKDSATQRQQYTQNVNLPAVYNTQLTAQRYPWNSNSYSLEAQPLNQNVYNYPSGQGPYAHIQNVPSAAPYPYPTGGVPSQFGCTQSRIPPPTVGNAHRPPMPGAAPFPQLYGNYTPF